jgi:hypothetical protein
MCLSESILLCKIHGFESRMRCHGQAESFTVGRGEDESIRTTWRHQAGHLGTFLNAWKIAERNV